MIIFLIIIFVVILLLFVNIKINIKIRVENTISYIEIQSLWIKFKRKGKFTLNVKEKNNDKNNIIAKRNKKVKNNFQIFLRSKFLPRFFKNIDYNEVKIYEKIGIINPFITSLALPFIALLTVIPLNYFKINYNKFKYEIIPDYNNLIVQFKLDANGYFRFFKILKLFILEFYLNNKTKVCTK